MTKLLPDLFKETIPIVYQLMIAEAEGGTSNWLLIKLIKLMMAFVEVEPRLVAKLTPVLYNMIQQNKPKSIEVELLQATFEYFHREKKLVELAITKLDQYLESVDPNLIFLGLGMLTILLKKDKQYSNRFNKPLMHLLVHNTADRTIWRRVVAVFNATLTPANI